MKNAFSLLFVATALTIMVGCDAGVTPTTQESLIVAGASAAKASDVNTLHYELAQVRAATARYHDVDQARADGYVDIDVFIPNMGFHYLKPDLLDDTFELTRPELLVYAPQGDGLRLVAVEYAVPVDLDDPAPAPEGFTGDMDVWAINAAFSLWTLHAWIWQDNPDGVFAPFNPRVP